jgi:hypothetical protein
MFAEEVSSDAKTDTEKIRSEPKINIFYCFGDG